jgi:MFS transporter, DHA2 family, multidrug resistance protein
VSAARGGSNLWAIAIAVTLGAFMEVLDTTIVNVALPHIAGSLAISNDESTWALTTYLVANGIVLTISGNLAMRMGRKRYFLLSVAGFTLTSFLCGISTNFVELLLFRGLQGFFGGGLQPTQQAIILDTFPPERRQQAFSVTAIATIVAPVLGPVVGGFLTDHYSWHWIFLINVPIGVGTFFAVMHLVEDSPKAKREARRAPPFDYWGLVFITMALGCLEVATDRGEDLDWLGSYTIRILYGISLLGFVVGTTYLLYARHPVVNLRVFRDRNFVLGTLAIGMMGFVLYESAVAIPQFAQTQLAYTATWAGLVLAPGALVLIALIPVVEGAMQVVPVKYVIALGGLALAGALFFSSSLVPELDFRHLAFLRATQTAALALLFVPISTAAYLTLPKKEHGDGAALFTMARNVLGGIGISVSTALITNHEQLRQHYQVEHLTPTYQPYNVLLQNLQAASMGLGNAAQAAEQIAPGQVFRILQSQSAVLAYNDVFIISGFLALLLVPIGLFMSGGKPKASGAA